MKGTEKGRWKRIEGRTEIKIMTMARSLAVLDITEMTACMPFALRTSRKQRRILPARRARPIAPLPSVRISPVWKQIKKKSKPFHRSVPGRR